MDLDLDRTYTMPVSFGPQPPHSAGVFDDVRTLMIVYRTTDEAIARLLPEPFVPGPAPLVYAYVQRCRGVNFLAGGEYRLFGVNVAATYAGPDESIDGSFALILWENHMEPILRGREILGIPKLLADVTDPEPADGRWRVAASDKGIELARLDFWGARTMSSVELESLQQRVSSAPWFGYKHIPCISGRGADVSQPTLIGIHSDVRSAWSCDGRLTIGNVTWEQSPSNAAIVAGLRSLPLLEIDHAYYTEGTVTLARAEHRTLHSAPVGSGGGKRP